VAKVMIWCAGKGKVVPTGLDLPPGTPFSGYYAHKFMCPECGRVHPLRMPFYEGTTPGRHETYWISTELMPEISAEVGVLLSLMAQIEHALPRLFEKLTGATWEDSITILGCFKGFSDKLELMKTIIARRPAPDEVCNNISQILPRLAEANTIRNKYAHGGYGIGKNDTLHLRLFPNDSRKKRRTEIKTLDDVVEEVNLVRRVTVDVEQLAFAVP
jgi:hypothetical protein